jgi:hypothetical protein
VQPHVPRLMAVDEQIATVLLSHLELDLPAPVGGWVAALKAKGIDIHTDDLGPA